MIIKSYLYWSDNCLIRIKTKRKPSLESTTKSGTWVVNELINGEWLMPCFPEIVWETLRKLKFIGYLKEEI
jgi:hypothetical protein